MSVEGVCQVCESRAADHSCSLCGALVCPSDYDRTQGCCVQCASGSGGGDSPLGPTI